MSFTFLVQSLVLTQSLHYVAGLGEIPWPPQQAPEPLASKPPMGWNSYNRYSCAPTESIIHENAHAIVDLGLKDLGYTLVTVDCGWTLPDRNNKGELTWNPDRFPKGFPNLGQFIHSLGLKFGIYQDAGKKTCMTGAPEQAGSLGHEELDAKTFQSWGFDALKYDNCFSSPPNYLFTDYAPTVSPQVGYKAMRAALDKLPKKVEFAICNWGVDFPAAWAPELGTSWRTGNDIVPRFSTVARILNQVVPQTSYAGPGHWMDLDLLEIGNGVMTIPEEQTHFSMWAILKSPLMISTALKTIPPESLAILKNKVVIGYNQDSLGVAARLRRRYSSGGYEVWSMPLSNGKLVVAVVNLRNERSTLSVILPDVGLQGAGIAKDIWKGVTYKALKPEGVTYKALKTEAQVPVEAHGVILLELDDIVFKGQYPPSQAQITDTGATWFSVYGLTDSNRYLLQFDFSKKSTKDQTITLGDKKYKLPANTERLTVDHYTLRAVTNNTVALKFPKELGEATLQIEDPLPDLIPSTSFKPKGASSLITCAKDFCTPVGSKFVDLTPENSAVATIRAPPGTLAGAKYLKVYFCNNDIAFASAFTDGTNTRNLTISVNGVLTGFELPLSGNSSEIFGPTKGWQDSGSFPVLVDNWNAEDNQVVVGNEGGHYMGADFVGFDIFW